MEYFVLKSIHVTTVAISFSLFAYRLYGVVWDKAFITTARWLKFVPHINDTILLGSAVLLAIELGINPGENSWLMAKIIALLIYIVLGSFALKRGKTKTAKLFYGTLAMLTFIYIACVAVSKNVFVLAPG